MLSLTSSKYKMSEELHWVIFIEMQSLPLYMLNIICCTHVLIICQIKHVCPRVPVVTMKMRTSKSVFSATWTVHHAVDITVMTV